jgi:hypothetical protein
MKAFIFLNRTNDLLEHGVFDISGSIAAGLVYGVLLFSKLVIAHQDDETL